MSSFADSLWADEAFSNGYREKAAGFLPERPRLMAIFLSYFHRFCLRQERPSRVLDLGCGDGVVTEGVLDCFLGIEPTLVDGSAAMLAAARERLVGTGGLRLVEATFQELLADPSLLAGETFDCIVSSLAVHHLTMAEKRRLFAWGYDRLVPGGHLVLIDVVLGASSALESWYMELWREAIRRHNPDDSDLLGIPRQYKENRDNVPDTLTAQLEALAGAGFDGVDCFYKSGIFAVFGGRKGAPDHP